MKNKVSVIFATYNEKKNNLQLSLNSVLNQTYNNIEIVICLEPDEKNKKFIKKILKNTSHLIIESKKKLGLSGALNSAIEKSTGNYIARMDSDDIWLKNKIKKQLEYIIENRLDVIGSDVQLINENGKKVGIRKYSKRNVETNLLFQNGICHPSVFLRKSVLNKYGNYDSAFKYCEDLELWLRLLSKGVKFGYIPEVLLKYRVASNYDRDFVNWEYNFRARLRYVFSIYNPLSAFLSLIISICIYFISVLRLNLVFNLLYRKLVINEKI